MNTPPAILYDPYEFLGVPRDASTEVIHEAYRQRAKSLHPDVGGDAELFQLLHRAHSCLSHTDSRRHFDQTGEVTVPPPENEHLAPLMLVQNVMDELAMEFHKAGRDLAGEDAIGLSVIRLYEKKHQAKVAIETWTTQAEIVESFAQGFRAKSKAEDNLLTPMFMARGRAVREKIAGFANESEVMDKALEILKRHTFQRTPKTKH